MSPPKTMKAFPTSKLACPTLGPGPSDVVATGKHVNAPGLASTIHRSPFTVLPLIRPPMRYIEPSLLDTPLTAAPYRGNGFVCWTVKFNCLETHGYGDGASEGRSADRAGGCMGGRIERIYISCKLHSPSLSSVFNIDLLALEPFLGRHF